jgi:cyclohexanone monooxygenase
MVNGDLFGPLDFDPAQLQAKYDRERTIRMRTEGKAQYIPTSGRFAGYSRDPWSEQLTREPLTDHTKVVIAGEASAGWSRALV